MKDVVHIIDSSTPADNLDQMLLVREPDEEIISIGPAPGMEWDGKVKTISKPFGFSSAAAGKLSRAVAPGAVMHLWSAGLAETASRAAEKIGGHLVLSLPHLPLKSEDFEDLPWLIGSLKCMLTVPVEKARTALLDLRADPSRVAVLPPAAGIMKIDSEIRREVRGQLGLDGDDLVLTTTTEMILHAGHKLAIWAHAIVRRIRDRVRLLFPGSGPEFHTVRSFAESTGYIDDVFFTGDRFTKSEIASASDIALFCRQTSCGLTRPVTAMANGLVVAATITDEMSEICTNGIDSVIFGDNTPQEISRGLLLLVDSPELRSKISEAGSRSAQDKYNPDIARKCLGEIYDRL